MSKLGKEGQNWHYGNCFKSLNDKMLYSFSSPIKPRKKTWGEQKFDAVGSVWENLREREHFSLEIRAIRPSAVFGTRRRIALRGEGFT